MPVYRRRDFLVISACTVAAGQMAPRSLGEDERNVDHGVFLSSSRIAALRKCLEERRAPQVAAYRQIVERAEGGMARDPDPPEVWYVPGYYRDAAGHRSAKQSLMDQANDTYAMALVAIMEKDEARSAGYRRRAIAYLEAWSSRIRALRREDDSTLSFSYHFTPFILAADLLRRYGDGEWPAASQSIFAEFLERRALPMNTMDRQNNWGNWGLSLAAAIAAYLDDARLVTRCVARWREFIARQIDEQGEMPHEVHRNDGRSGLWYTHFALLPQAIAAEILRLQGIDLYEYQSSNGRTMRMAYERAAAWANRPTSFRHWTGDAKELHGADYVGYFELLNPRWLNADAKSVLERTRPTDTRHGAPYLTFTHGDLPPDLS